MVCQNILEYCLYSIRPTCNEMIEKCNKFVAAIKIPVLYFIVVTENLMYILNRVFCHICSMHVLNHPSSNSKELTTTNVGKTIH